MGVQLGMAVLAVSLLFAGALSVTGQSLLTLLPDDGRRSSLAPCLQPGVETCTLALVNRTLLETSDIIVIPGPENTEILLSLSSRSDNSAVYKNGLGKSAYFTWTGTTLSGQVQAEANSWSLEGCGEDCFTWVKQDRTTWKEETCEEASAEQDSTEKKQTEYLKSLGESDTTTVVTYTVMLWYTQEFRNLFATSADMDAFTDLVILETNEAYISGNMPVRIQKHCLKQHPTINEDDTDSSTILSNFASSMSTSDLRHSADTAALLVADLSGCGIAYTHTTGSCYTISVTKKSCATGYYSFGHELGHNFGAKHNVEKYSSSSLSSHPYSYGHGYLIKPTGPTKYSGYRTILAYFADGHYNRINHYSDPGEICPDCLEADSVLGDDEANNAKVITDNRFAMAACGAEDNVSECSAPAPAPSPATTKPPTTTVASCVAKYMKNKTVAGGKKIKMKKTKTKTAAECWEKCVKNAKCKYITWVQKTKNKKLKKVCTLFSSIKKIRKKKGIVVASCK